jgi:hypothetical protein
MNRTAAFLAGMAGLLLFVSSGASQDDAKKAAVAQEQKQEPEKKEDFFGFFTKSNTAIQNIPFEDLLFRLGFAFALGCVIAGIYRLTQRPDSVSSTGFVSTIVLLCILIAIVTQVVGDSGARAFSLVGILSIVRFRTVVEDTRDTAFVIFAVMIGMAAGIDNRQVAVVGLLVTGAAAVMLRYMPGISNRSEANWVLQLRVGTTAGGATPWDAVLSKNCVATQLQTTATARQGASLDLTYKIKLKKEITPVQLLNEINRIEGIQNLELKRET